MNENTIGKKIRLNEYNLTYGKQEKILNVVCFYKYKKDNNLYTICCEDSNIPYGIINYGSAHQKGNTLILIGLKEPKEDMIKELLFKIDKEEELDNFVIQDLKDIEMIELISPNKFEIKKEVLESIIDKTIPKPIKEEIKSIQKKKKKPTLIIVLIILFIISAFFCLFILNEKHIQDSTIKSIICKKEYNSTELEAKVIEDNTYNFNQNDKLKYINKSTTYKFYQEEEYLEFVNKGLYYSYIPEENGGFSLDNDTYSLIIIEKEETNEDYFLPTEYEEVLSYYKGKDYNCKEEAKE